MRRSRTLAEVVGAGVRFDADEAVAIVQELIASSDTAESLPEAPPSLGNVWLGSDGSVTCPACGRSAGVLEMGLLLQALLPPDGPTRVPGALRFTIARAVRNVLADPFDSLTQFSAALRRHEKTDRSSILRELYARAERAQGIERRRAGPSTTELRRQLREADLERYLLLVAKRAPSSREPAPSPHLRLVPPPQTPPVRSRRRLSWRRWSVGLWAILILLGAGYGVTHHPQRGKVGGPTAPVMTTPSEVPRVQQESGRRRPPLATITVPKADRSIVRVVDKSNGTGFSPAFGASDTTLFFHSGRSGDSRSALEVVDLTGTRPGVRTIIDDGARNYHVQPSPTGDRLAYDSDRDGERGVYVANSDGSGARRVSGAGYAAVPTWSPDGHQLAFIRAESTHPRVWNLWLLALDTGETRRLTNFRYGQTWSASWFHDGRRICYTHEDRLFIRDLVTGATRQFESPVKGRLARTPAASPDGKRVIFQVATSGAWLLDVESGAMTRVLSDRSAEEFAWSPDGRRVAFHSRRDGEWGIWVLSPS